MKIRNLIALLIGLLPTLLSFQSPNQGIVIEWHALRSVRDVRNDGSLSEVKQKGLGHSYVIVKNFTPSSVNVGYFSLSAYDQVSVGLWTAGVWGSSSIGSSGSSGSSSDSSSNKHDGVLYNYERYFFYYKEKPVDDIYAKVTIDNNKLSEISQIIKDKNNTYNLMTYNCATFSTEIWNKAANKSFWTGWFRTPDYVIADIKGNYTYYNGNYLTPSQTFSYYNGSYLVTVEGVL